MTFEKLADQRQAPPALTAATGRLMEVAQGRATLGEGLDQFAIGHGVAQAEVHADSLMQMRIVVNKTPASRFLPSAQARQRQRPVSVFAGA